MKKYSLIRNTLMALTMTACGISSAAAFAPKSFTPMDVQVAAEGAAAAGVTLPSGYAWYKFANHTHTTYSDGYVSLEERLQEAASNGADAVSILDHRTQDACSDPLFTTTNGCVPMCGEEWGWDFHVGMLNMEAGDPMRGWSLEAAIPVALSRGATLVVHHPFTIGSAPWPYADFNVGIRCIEVWTTLAYSFSGSIEATAWWNGFLKKGRLVVAIGGSDMHTSGNSLSPCNYVLATSPQPDALQQAIEAGRITISADSAAARCFVWCDADGDGTYESPVGTTVPVTEHRTLPFRVEVYSGEGRTLNIITSTGPLASLTVGEGDPWRADLLATVEPNTKDYVRAEIPDPDDALNPMDCITNPIYVNFTDGDADGDGLSDAFESQIGTDKYDADTDGDGISDSFEVGYDGNSNDYNPYDPANNQTGTDLDAASNDTDGDGVKDRYEETFGTNPLDPSSKPALPVAPYAMWLLFLLCLSAGGSVLQRQGAAWKE